MIAFIIALKTYISIDSVNVISKMDGNVLENESYITSTPRLINEYTMIHPSEVGDKLFDDMYRKFTKESKTALTFAENLQDFIDVLVFIPSLFNNSNKKNKEHNQRINQILELIEMKKQDFVAISTGDTLLIKETVKLIRYVMNYQESINVKGESITATSLMEVKGTMIKNPVTRTVYYNYLGLFYNKKAMEILRRKLEVIDLLHIENLKKVLDCIHNLEEDEAELYTMYLNESKQAFNKAITSYNNDIMWEGFIKYNDARTTYFLHLINREENKDWITFLDEAIIARKKLNILINDILVDDNCSHLRKYFLYEEQLARLVKYNILIAEKKDITNTNQQVIYMYKEYNGLLKDKFLENSYYDAYPIIDDYQKSIIRNINGSLISS